MPRSGIVINYFIPVVTSSYRKAARDLLTLDEKDPRRVFEGTIFNIEL